MAPRQRFPSRNRVTVGLASAEEKLHCVVGRSSKHVAEYQGAVEALMGEHWHDTVLRSGYPLCHGKIAPKKYTVGQDRDIDLKTEEKH